MRKFLKHLLAAALPALAISLSAQAAVVSTPFKANVAQAGAQAVRETYGTHNGGWVTTWNDAVTSSNYMRRFNADGVAQGGDFGLGSLDFVDYDRLGNIYIVRTAADASGSGVYVAVYNRNGYVLVPEFRVNSTTTANQAPTALAVNASGAFAVGWMDYSTSPARIMVKRFNPNGSVAMPDTAFNTVVASNAGMTDIAIDAAGNIVVAWVTVVSGSGGPNADSWIRRYSNTGVALTGPIMVNTYTTSIQAGLELGMNAQGEFAACWESYGQDGNEYGAYFQRFNASAAKIGGEQRVNTTTVGNQWQCDVGMMDDGAALVVWNHDNRLNVSSSLSDVRLRQYRADATPLSSLETTLAMPAGTHGFWPHPGLDPAGNALIGWQSYSIAGNNYDDAWVQRFTMDTRPAIATLASGQTATNLSGAAASWRYYRVTIPAGTASMTIGTTGPGTMNPDTYLRLGALPTTSAWDIRPATNGSTETIIVNNPLPGEWYIGIYGQTAYSGLNLSFTRN